MNNDVIELLKKALAPLQLHTAIVFGSYAEGKPGQDSDIDLLAVLNDNSSPKNYQERRQNRLRVRKVLASLNREYPLDLLVYTIPEWKTVVDSKSAFIREILKKGVYL